MTDQIKIITPQNDDEHGRMIASFLWDTQILTTFEEMHGDKLKGFFAELTVRLQNEVRSRFVKKDGKIVEVGYE